MPNFAWRRKAIDAHDLHHVLTGYPCTMRGEFQMAAWEFGAGRMPHWAATLFCLPLVLAGLLWAPRRMFHAFSDGCGSYSFHDAAPSERVLAMPLDSARAALTSVRAANTPWSDGARFALLIARATLLSLTPAALLVAIWLLLRF